MTTPILESIRDLLARAEKAESEVVELRKQIEALQTRNSAADMFALAQEVFGKAIGESMRHERSQKEVLAVYGDDLKSAWHDARYGAFSDAIRTVDALKPPTGIR